MQTRIIHAHTSETLIIAHNIYVSRHYVHVGMLKLFLVFVKCIARIFGAAEEACIQFCLNIHCVF